MQCNDIEYHAIQPIPCNNHIHCYNAPPNRYKQTSKAVEAETYARVHPYPDPQGNARSIFCDF